MDEQILSWLDNKIQQPSRRNFQPNQAWMNASKINGSWEKPKRRFVKELRIHMVAQLADTWELSPKISWKTIAEYRGLPNNGGFMVVLHEDEQRLHEYRNFETRWISHTYFSTAFIVQTQSEARQILLDYKEQYTAIHKIISDDMLWDFPAVTPKPEAPRKVVPQKWYVEYLRRNMVPYLGAQGFREIESGISEQKAVEQAAETAPEDCAYIRIGMSDRNPWSNDKFGRTYTVIED